VKKKPLLFSGVLILTLILPLFFHGKIPRLYSDTLELNIANGDLRLSKYYYYICYSQETNITIFSKYLPQSPENPQWREVGPNNRLKNVAFLIKMLEEIKSFGESDENMKIYTNQVMEILKEEHSSVAVDYVHKIWGKWIEKTSSTVPLKDAKP